jgi:hypothetical protein
MRLAKSLAIAVLAAPAIALAQPSYYVREAPLAREELRECMYRDEDLTRRDAQIATEKRLNDREGAAIARAASMLAEDLRRLDSTDVAAVAAHNARAAEHNRRVDAHNLRVNDQNAEAARLNRDQADMSASCGTRSYYPRDRDAIIIERSVIAR